VKSKKVVTVLTIVLLALNLVAPITLDLLGFPAAAASTESQNLFANIEYARYNISEYRLLIIVLDAVRYDYVVGRDMPFIVGYLKDRSLWFWGYTQLQSATRPFRAHLSSGTIPWFTGIDTNDRTNVWTGFRTIVDTVHDMGYKTVAVIDCGGYAFFSAETDARWTTGDKASWTDYVVFGSSDPETQHPTIVVNYTVQMLDTHPDWKLMWVEFHYPDRVGHTYGWDSPEFEQAVKDTDEGVRQIYEELEKRGILNETVILIVTDHGGHGTTHGDVIEKDMRIWGLIHVPDEAVVGVYEFATPSDITATIAYLMGIPLHEYATGITLAGDAKVRYSPLNVFGTTAPSTTPVTLPNGTVIEADHLLLSNGYYTMLFTLYNDTQYVHNLGAVTFAALTATPSTGYQFMEVAKENPTRSDLVNLNFPSRLNTLYTSTTAYYPTTFSLMTGDGGFGGSARSITGSDFSQEVTNPSNDLVEKSLVIEEYGGAAVFKYYARTQNAGFSGSYSLESRINIYAIPGMPFVIYDVEITNLDTVDLTDYYPGIRTVIQPTFHTNNYAFLDENGDIVYETTLSTATPIDGMPEPQGLE